ncbi:TetR/AcrR family transcriptional regulator [Microbispora sp. CA-102843]|uniref:TetR/AcrR family transcriptional regulator n=1 Tax=Microbispora sp. CA-102843 TaxID=3239952 RepID=UPI003D90E705
MTCAYAGGAGDPGWELAPASPCARPEPVGAGRSEPHCRAASYGGRSGRQAGFGAGRERRSGGRVRAGPGAARASIRDAAMTLFAEQGVKATTIRGIAEAAKVSPGLVQHHFGTKEALRQACDEYVLSYLREQVTVGPRPRARGRFPPQPPRCSTNSSA